MECAQLRTEKEELAQQLAAIRTTGVRKVRHYSLVDYVCLYSLYVFPLLFMLAIAPPASVGAWSMA